MSDDASVAAGTGPGAATVQVRLTPLAGVALLLALTAWLVFPALRGLFNPDEGRYAEIPREMLASGDWVIPHLNGLVYIEKPPLQYWASAISEAVFGRNDWAARLYTALCSVATVCVTFLMTRCFGAAAAWRAALMLGSSLLFILLGQQLTLDMGLTLWMTVTLAGFCAAQRASGRRRQGFMLLAWAGTAAAFLTKGLVAGVLPVLTLILYSLLQRDLGPWRRLSLLRGVPLFLVVSLPWFVLIQQRLPQFFNFFFVREHFQRFLTRIEDRYQPWWFFVPILLAGSLPWLLPAVRALATGWRAQVPRPEFDLRRFVWLWCAMVFVFFSASDSKLIPYILPMFPALALLMATLPGESLRRDLSRTTVLLAGLGVLVLVGALLLPKLLHDPARAPLFIGIRGPLALMGACFLIGAVALRRARGEIAPVAVAAGAGYGAFMSAIWAAMAVAPLYSGSTLVPQLPAALLQSARDGDIPVYSVGTYDQSLTFYLEQPVTLVEWRGELDFGLSLEPQRFVPTVADFESRWRAAPQALAVVEPRTYVRLQGDGLPMVVRATSPKHLIVSRQ